MSTLERKRLHISPFDPNLLPLIIPAVITEQASNISFHALQTFPERNYGYVDLPVMDAEKIKKTQRLHLAGLENAS